MTEHFKIEFFTIVSHDHRDSVFTIVFHPTTRDLPSATEASFVLQKLIGETVDSQRLFSYFLAFRVDVNLELLISFGITNSNFDDCRESLGLCDKASCFKVQKEELVLFSLENVFHFYQLYPSDLKYPIYRQNKNV